MLNGYCELFRNNLKYNIRNNFDKRVRSYAENGSVQAEIAQILLKEVVNQIDCSLVGQTLEIGCGTGFLSKHLVSYFSNARHFISDLSLAMIKKCREDISSINVEYLACDGESLSFKENIKFDLIIANMALHWFQEFDLSTYSLFKMTNVLAFSVPIQDTFQIWAKAHDRLNIQNKMLEFYSLSDLKEILVRNKPKKLLIKTIDLDFPVNSAFEFLQYLKLIGATTNMNTNTTPYTVRELKNLCREVDKQGSEVANYKIAVCVLIK